MDEQIFSDNYETYKELCSAYEPIKDWVEEHEEPEGEEENEFFQSVMNLKAKIGNLYENALQQQDLLLEVRMELEKVVGRDL